MDLKRALVVTVALAACSGGRPKSDDTSEPARKHDAAITASAPLVHDASMRVAMPTGPYHVVDEPKGDVQVTAVWQDVPLASRSSAGRTTCGTPRAGAVAPTVLWGIPEVFVLLAIDHGKAPGDPEVRVTLDHCALVPRVAVAADTIVVTSAADAPAKLTITKQGDVHGLDKVAPGGTRAIGLPIAGHSVSVPLEAGGVYQIAIEGDPEASWIISAATPYTSITDPTGHAILRDVPVGTYGVVAWLPARAGQPARVAHGEVTVTAGSLGEVTLDLTKP